YLIRCWIRIFVQESGGRHYLAGLTITALGNIHFFPGQLYRVVAIFGKSFNGGNLLSGYRGDGQRTTSYRIPVQMNRAGTALGDTTTILGSYQVQMISQYPQ